MIPVKTITKITNFIYPGLINAKVSKIETDLQIVRISIGRTVKGKVGDVNSVRPPAPAIPLT